MPQGSVAHHLRSSWSNLLDRGTTLEWSVRMRVATRVAKALAYLHEDCDPEIIHRDIKALNELLDEKYQVALSDFGLAVVMDYEETCVQSDVAGTGGHVDPDMSQVERMVEGNAYNFSVE
ncbi:hypothetical protein ACJRO7_007454 [Eucalyptus globulus]|uniref:non-specific serine/threonine protein kinase n=1 Tax=Eucalyptus globulus TaxID=34317 RepID=A0ABD3IP37_EUCGL